MNTVANLWWLWGLIMFATFFYGAWSHLRFIRKGDLAKGYFVFLVAAFVNMVSTILLILSIVLLTIDYAKR